MLSKRRIRIVTSAIALLFMTALLRTVQVQVIEFPLYAQAASAQQIASVNTLAPRGSWLPVMRQILEGMKKSLSIQKTGVFELKRSIELGGALLSEVEAAVKDNRPARVVHGFRPEEISPELRSALGLTLSLIHI